MKTIKELAEEQGYSKQYITKIIRQLKLQTSLRKFGNKFMVDEEQERLILSVLGEKTTTENRQQLSNEATTVLQISLRSEIENLRSQLSEKDQQIEKLYQLLDQQQQLLLNEQQKNQLLLEEVKTPDKKWWQIWK